MSTRIIIVDDHPLFRGALRQALTALLPGAEVTEAAGFEDLTPRLAEGEEVDMVLLDLTMPGVQGFSGLLYLRAQHPEVPVVIVSATEDPIIIRRALEFGASGFVPKSLDIQDIGVALQAVLSGETWTPPDVNLALDGNFDERARAARLSRLTPQQLRVLMMLSEGLLNKQIAYELDVSEATVKAHVSAILQKLGVDSRTQAVIAASKMGATQIPAR